MNKYCSCLILLFVFGSVFYGSTIHCAENTSDDFWEEPLKKWNEYLKISGCFGCFMREQITWPGESKDHSIEVIGHYPYFLSTVNLSDKSESVYGFNNKYTFRISRVSPSLSQWTVDSIEPLPPNSTLCPLSFSKSDFSSKLYPNKNVRDVMCAGLRIRIYWLPELVQSKNFKVVSCNFSEEEQKKVAIIKFVYEKGEIGNSCDITEGTLVLLPDYYWLIHRCECIFSDGNRENDEIGKIENEYELAHDGVPFLTKNRETGIDRQGRNVLTVVREYSGYTETKDTPSSRFTLSYYGIPEPDFDNYQVNHFRYVLITIALGMIVWSLVAMVRKRRQQHCLEEKLK